MLQVELTRLNGKDRDRDGSKIGCLVSHVMSFLGPYRFWDGTPQSSWPRNSWAKGRSTFDPYQHRFDAHDEVDFEINMDPGRWNCITSLWIFDGSEPLGGHGPLPSLK